MIKVTYPWLFLCFFVPFLFYMLLPRIKSNNSALAVPFFKSLVSKFSNSSLSNNNDLSVFKYLLVLIWLLIVISSMGVKWLGDPLQVPQEGRNIMIAIDLSGSMQTPDMSVNGTYYKRIDIVKEVAKKFVEERVGDKIGLILFGSKAYLQTPLTFDRVTVDAMLTDATIGLAGEQTAMGDGIALADKQFLTTPGSSKALILLTDGGNNAGVFDPLEAAKIAKREDIKIYTIGIGAKQLEIQTMGGPKIINPSDDLDINALKEISKLTGGKFFRAEDGNQLQDIYSNLNQLELTKSNPTTLRPITEFYPWTLGFALILFYLLILIKLKG